VDINVGTPDLHDARESIKFYRSGNADELGHECADDSRHSAHANSQKDITPK